jgi:hypothetical protein
MNELIKECVEYSNPKPVQDPNPADKNKKIPPKGK